MFTNRNYIGVLLSLLLCASAGVAQDGVQEKQAGATIAKDVTIIIQQKQVRFTAQKAVEKIQLQVFDQAGETIFDSGPILGAEINWPLQNVAGEPLKSGIYAYKLSLTDAGSEEARVRRGQFIVDQAKDREGMGDRLWITARTEDGVGTELTVASNADSLIAATGNQAHEENRKGDNQSEVEKKEDEKKSDKNKAASIMSVDGSGTVGNVAKFISANEIGNSVITEVNGNVGIGTSTPNHQLSLGWGPPWTKYNWGGAVELKNGSAIGWNANAAGNRFGIGHTDNGFYFFRTKSDPGTTNELPLYDLHINKNGNVGIGIGSAIDGWKPPNHRLRIGSGPAWTKVNWSGSVELDNGSAIGWHANAAGNRFGIGHTDNGFFIFRTKSDPGTTNAYPEYDLTINDFGTTSVRVLQITGGADFAENFDVTALPASNEGNKAEPTKVEAGMVVSIDPANPGKLRLSSRAYDRGVVGIISGAGGVNPGMIMGQEGTPADGKHPVALSGRVYCWVDARYGAVKPGDLLTTSPTPGHAMKVRNSAKAQGAIIGKAMTGLKRDKGLTLMLVTLQ